jgi:DNA-binding NtrC family response regulator
MIDSDGIDGLSVYKEIKRQFPGTHVIMLSSAVTIPQAVEAAKIGVSDFIKKPVAADKLLQSVKSNFLPEGAVRIKADPSIHGQWLAGSGENISSLFAGMEEAITSKSNVLFIAGKGIDISGLVELFHFHSGPSLKIRSLDMIPFQKESLETIFWTTLQDSIVDSDIVYFCNFNASPAQQRKSIIDFIKARTSKGRVRVVASLESDDDDGPFGGWQKIAVPRLNDRKEDLPEILAAYIEHVSLDVLGYLARYSWPGNYREFEAAVENAVLCAGGDVLTLKDFQISGRMLDESILSSQPYDLLEFKKRAEKIIMGLFLKKSASPESAAELLDVPIGRLKDI